MKKIKQVLRRFVQRKKSKLGCDKSLPVAYQQMCRRSLSLDDDFIAYQEHQLKPRQIEAVKHIALYLPQFHSIVENDQWWGKNFTEWNNVAKAVPQYFGQYQPQLPVDVGFYDLTQKPIWQQQIAMAKNYGVYGFCYYFYWFNGRRILEKPLDLFLKNKDLDMPFCLFWANDSWVRTWHGFSDFEQGNRVLLAQNHNDQDDVNVMNYLCEHVFSDERYIKIDDKPLFIVYHTPLFNNIKKTLSVWRLIAKQHGFKDLYLMHVMMPGQEDGSLLDVGFDAAMQFSPIGCDRKKANVQLLNPDFSGEVYDYEYLIKKEGKRIFKHDLIARGCFASWDNEGRRPTKGISYANGKPALFYEYLRSMARWAKAHPLEGESFIFLNAWNEWAEGAHLEPDRKYGYAWLEQLAQSVKKN